MTLAERAEAVRRGDTAARRIGAIVNDIAADTLNAFIATDPRALERAHHVDGLAAAGADPGPLAGVAIGLKDMIDHAGRETTAGSSFYRNTPEKSATVVERLEAAGAIIVGRTGLHEFAYGFSSENDWFGPVRNPWDPSTSPGGSSGGSAVAVATGMADAALGTDTGGSVRVPAALCGCIGLKVTHGRVPLSGVFPLAPSLDTVGPITKSVADAALMYQVMAGDDPEDPWSDPRPVERMGDRLALDGLTIAVPHPWVDRNMSTRTRRGFEAFRKELGGQGAAVVDVEAPWLDPTAVPRAAYAEVAGVHREWISVRPGQYGEAVRHRLLRDLEHTPDAITTSMRWRAGLRHATDRLFQDVDLLVTPTVVAERKMIGVAEMSVGASREPYRPVLSWFTTIANMLGIPALAMPILGTDGERRPPASVQLMAPRFSEALLLEVGLVLERKGVVGFTPPRP